jgi:hypothetical protein
MSANGPSRHLDKQKAKFMRLTPGVLPMLQLRSCQLTLLASLAFGAVLAVFSAPLAAQTTRDLPATIPDLSGYDSETRQLMELACVSHTVLGPVLYSECLNAQIASLQRSPGIPNLSGYDSETRHGDGYSKPARDSLKKLIEKPADRQIASLQRSPGIPNLSGYDSETRHTMELACGAEKLNGPVAYGTCLNRQIASLQRSPGIPSLTSAR